MNQRIDMSQSCGLMYFEMFRKMNDGIISLEEWERWYDDHCRSCMFMNEFCMFEEFIEKFNDIGLVNPLSPEQLRVALSRKVNDE